MAKFRYEGPLTAIALPTEEGAEPKEVILHPGIEADLPEDLEFVQRLVARGLLVLVEQPQSRKRNQQSEAQ